MKFKLFLITALACFMLAACEESESIETLIDKGLMFKDEPLEFVGYLDIDSRLYPSNIMRFETIKDVTTGCHYLFNGINETLSPYYDTDGSVYGCKDRIVGTDDKKSYSKKDYLNFLSKYYPDVDASELEYMLENVFNYGSISFSEFKDKVEYLNNTEIIEDEIDKDEIDKDEIDKDEIDKKNKNKE